MNLSKILEQYQDQKALIWQGEVFTYNDLLNAIAKARKLLAENNITQGSVVSLEADFSANSLAMLFSLIELKIIIAPLLKTTAEEIKINFQNIAEIETRIIIDNKDNISFINNKISASHTLIQKLKENHKAGLILFSSGSTGESKAVLHDFDKMLSYYKIGLPKTIITFLLFDHIGGINTLFHTLLSGGCIVTLSDRQTKTVCAAIEKYKVQILPTSPTFLNLLLISEEYKNYDLSSLEIVKYGTETMNEFVLKKFHNLFPNVKLKQTYGLSEIGVLSVKSLSSDSLLVKINDTNFQTRIVDNALEIKTDFSMLGYLNSAENPFTDDGWFKTNDVVEQDAEHIKILGRKSDIINVGGQKVYPAEIESALRRLNNIADVTVKGEANALVGQIVIATIKLLNPEELSILHKRIRLELKGELESFKIPQKIIIADDSDLYSARFKKLRK